MCKATLLEILQEVLAGNAPRGAFEKAFCDTYYEFIFLAARKFMRTNQDAEDVTQDVFIKKILRWELERFQSLLADNIEGFLYKTVKNYCSDFRRLHERNNLVKNIEGLPESVEESANRNHSEDLSVTELSKNIPIDVREILELKFLRGFTYKEIGGELDMTEGQIKMKIKRWKDKFKK